MTIGNELLASVGASITALDFTTENGRIAALELEISQIEAKVGIANDRRNEIAELLKPYRGRAGGAEPYAGVDGPAVADALLADLDPSEAAGASKSVEELEREGENLRQAVVDLRRRIEAAQREIADVRSRSIKQVQQVLQPVIDAISDNAQSAARRILECFGAIRAISGAANMGGLQFTALTNALDDGIMGQYRLLPFQAGVDVPAEISELLSGLANKGAALRPFLPRSIRTQ